MLDPTPKAGDQAFVLAASNRRVSGELIELDVLRGLDVPFEVDADREEPSGAEETGTSELASGGKP